jgi:hypothetical protein
VSALVLTKSVKEAIAKVVAFAEKHPITLEELMLCAKTGVPIGNQEMRTIDIPMNFRVTYTIEQQPRPMSWCKHISISLLMPRNPTKDMPSVEAVTFIMQEFGMTTPIDRRTHHLAIENVVGPENDGKKAVNVLEKITSWIAPEPSPLSQSATTPTSKSPVP